MPAPARCRRRRSGRLVRSVTSPIARVNRSMVAEMPHTMGIGGFEPGSPWMSRWTIVLRSAARFMPRCASSSTMTRSVALAADRVPQDVPERELAGVRAALGEAARLRELLRVEEVDATRREVGVRERLVHLTERPRGQELRGVEHPCAGLAVERRVVGDPEERDPRVGVGVQVGRPEQQRLDDRGRDDRLARAGDRRERERRAVAPRASRGVPRRSRLRTSDGGVALVVAQLVAHQARPRSGRNIERYVS